VLALRILRIARPLAFFRAVFFLTLTTTSLRKQVGSPPNTIGP
jgi:hypothetical protein